MCAVRYHFFSCQFSSLIRRISEDVERLYHNTQAHTWVLHEHQWKTMPLEYYTFRKWNIVTLYANVNDCVSAWVGREFVPSTEWKNIERNGRKIAGEKYAQLVCVRLFFYSILLVNQHIRNTQIEIEIELYSFNEKQSAYFSPESECVAKKKKKRYSGKYR